MCCTYVLKSLKTQQLYIGSTRKKPSERLGDHNKGKVRWTKSRRPFEIVYTEKFASYTEAKKRELFFKTGKGRTFIHSCCLINNTNVNWVGAGAVNRTRL